VIHLLVSNKHIQCIKWDHENGKPFLSSFSFAPFKSKKLSQNPTDKELVNEINTTLQLQKKRFSFEGEQVYVTIPDDFCSSCVIYPDEEMSEADGWELSKWTLGQRYTNEADSIGEFFGRVFTEKNKNIFSLKVSSLLTETIKISIQEMGGNPLWMGTESSAFYGLNPNRGITLLLNDKSGYEYYHFSKNSFTNGFAKFSKNKWRLSSLDGSNNESDIFKGQIIIPGKLSYRRKSHFEGKRIRQVEPFKNIKKNDVKIPKESTVYSQAISSALIRGNVLGYSLNFFKNPGLQDFEEPKETLADPVTTKVNDKKRKKLSKKKKSNFQQFFAYLFFFGALTAVIFRDQLPDIYENIEKEVREFLKPSQPTPIDDKISSNTTSEIIDFNQVDFIRSQSLAHCLLNLTSVIDGDQILRFEGGKGKINVILTGSKNSLFPVDTIGSILNYSLRQIEGKDLYEFGYLIQYDAYLNDNLSFDDYISLIELLDNFENIIDLDVKTLDPYSHNALEHTPIIVSSNDMNSFRDVLSYILSSGSNLVLNKVTMNVSNADMPNTVRLFITYLNYSDS
tara:strand:+ start:877 stop:2571 length:1695 start_codon:yes stop_codon:yes gene_type:complete